MSNVNQTCEQRPIAVGDTVMHTGERGVGTVTDVFHTPWDTMAKGPTNTRTVARVDWGDGTYGAYFPESLERVE